MARPDLAPWPRLFPKQYPCAPHTVPIRVSVRNPILGQCDLILGRILEGVAKSLPEDPQCCPGVLEAFGPGCEIAMICQRPMLHLQPELPTAAVEPEGGGMADGSFSDQVIGPALAVGIASHHRKECCFSARASGIVPHPIPNRIRDGPFPFWFV